MASTRLLASIVQELLGALKPIQRLRSSPNEFSLLLTNFGWPPPTGFNPTPLLDVFDVMAELELTSELVDQMADDESGDVAALLADLQVAVKSIITKIRAIDGAMHPGGLPAPYDTVAFWESYSSEFFEYLLLLRIEQHMPVIASLLQFVGVIHEEEVPAAGGRQVYFRREIEWNNILRLFYEPDVLLAETYEWGSQPFNHEKLLRNLQLLLGNLHKLRISSPSTEVLDDYFSSQNPVRNTLQELSGPIVEGFSIDAGSFYELNVYLLPIPPEDEPDGEPVGLVVGTRFGGTAALTFSNGPFHFVLKGGIESENGPRIEFRPGTVAVQFDASPPYFDAGAEFSIHRENPILLFGSYDSHRLQIGRLSAGVELSGTPPNLEFNVNIGLTDLELVIQMGEGDGFLQKIIGEEPQSAKMTLKLSWSSEYGLAFSGSATLSVTMPLHIELGPLNLDEVSIDVLATTDEPVRVGVGVTGGVTLGPISASIKRIGAVALFQKNEQGDGSFGSLDLDLAFLPPTGVGLSIDAGITGGGFIEFDTINERYAGILALSFGEIAITAIGLITTKMPGGKKGFSLLINIGVIFDPPIELFSGFTLSGVGGLVGINRSMDIEVLQRGIKNKTLDSILFPDPKTVVANATKIISDMRAVFPPTEERFVVGPMVKLGWGYPNIIIANIGIFIELPDPIRIVLMGQVKAAFPEKDNALVSINLDILGVLDFAKEVLTFQASLYDSKVLCFVIYGDSAFLLAWGNDPRFALSLGGFHPKFTPPPPPIIFADLKRLTIGISSGSDFQLTCQAYQALTPNSLQFGARVDLYAAVAGAVVTGYMGFEALFYFSPFSFEVWIGAGVSIKYQGASLADVELSFTLSGPTPWNARGKAIIRILFIDVDVGFDITWGNSQQIPIAAENPWLKLEPALRAAGNWGSGLPRGRKMVEALRGAEGDSAELDTVRVHPTGRLEIKQNVVPLNTRLGKIGNAPVKDFNRFEITDVRINGNSLGVGAVQEFFSRGQFEQLNNQQKLSVPSFEKMPGGVASAVPADVRRAGATESIALTYESIIINADRTSERQLNTGELEWTEANLFVAASNLQRALKRSGPRGRYMSVQPDPKVGASEEHYCVVKSENLSRATLTDVAEKANENMTRMSADYALQAHLSQVPDDAGKLMVVPEYEVAA